MHLVSKAWILFFRLSKQGSCFTAVEEDGGDEKLVELELVCKKLMVLHRQILFILAIAGAILTRISAEHVASLQRVVPRYLKLVLNVSLKKMHAANYIKGLREKVDFVYNITE